MPAIECRRVVRVDERAELVPKIVRKDDLGD
jgi:hypothetical protein